MSSGGIGVLLALALLGWGALLAGVVSAAIDSLVAGEVGMALIAIGVAVTGLLLAVGIVA